MLVIIMFKRSTFRQRVVVKEGRFAGFSLYFSPKIQTVLDIKAKTIAKKKKIKINDKRVATYNIGKMTLMQVNYFWLF